MTGTGTLDVDGADGAHLGITGVAAWTGDTAIALGNTLTLAGDFSGLTGMITIHGMLEVASAGVLASPITGDGTFLKSGTGIVTLAAEGSFTGEAILAEGRLALADGNALGAAVLHFADNGHAVLALEAGEGFAGTITGFGAGDTIAFTGFDAATASVALGGDLLRVADAFGHSLTLHLGSDASAYSYGLVVDGGALDLVATFAPGIDQQGGDAPSLLEGGLGADTLTGGNEDDVYIVNNPGDTVIETGSGGHDEVRTDQIVYVLAENVEDLTGTGNGQQLTGNDLDNRIVAGSGNDTLSGGAGSDTLKGGAGNDVYYVTSGDTVIENAGSGTDEVRTSVANYVLPDNVEILTAIAPTSVANALRGGTTPSGAPAATGQVLTGNALANTITGGAGDDVIDGRAGADAMAGGAGNDTYHVDNFGDTVTEAANAGTDTIVTTLSSYALGDNVENLIGTSAQGQWLVGNALANQIAGGAGNDSFDLSAGGTDIASGGAGDDLAYYGASFGAGDRVIGGAGSDTLVLQGNYSFAFAADALDGVERIALLSGANRGYGDFAGNAYRYLLSADDANLATGATLTVDGSGLSASEQLRFDGTAETSGSFVLLGGAANDLLRGGAGGDRIDGGAGIDTMLGGLGDDVYVVDNAGDVVREAAGEGNDRVESAITYSLAGQYIEQLTLTGTAAVNGAGNSLDNILIGNSAVNMLTGGAGNDTLDGGAGADLLLGGTGDDVYVVDNAGDRVIENIGEGNDEVRASVSFALTGQYIEKLTLTGNAAIDGTGNALDNVITGNDAANKLGGGAGNDVLDGHGGADTLIGGVGDDTYYVDNIGDRVLENIGEGNDSIFSTVSFSIAGQYIEALTLIGTAAINATGNSLDNVLTGNGAANTLNGAAGNDKLDGGAGADKMYGGLGDDSYVVDNSGDRVYENAGEGNDTVFASVSFSIAGQYIEALTLTGANAIDGTGNSLNNVLTGNAAANTLNGGAGDDALHGGLGDDRLIGGAGHDSFWFDTAIGGNNIDTIVDFHAGEDMIYLDHAIFTALAGGALDAGAFHLGTEAGDASDRIVYDMVTGKLWYDADGTGSGAAVQFGQLTPGTELGADSFHIAV